MLAWEHWYHSMGNTYGTWLPGDPRGFRTKHERQHIEGDYRNPPPRGKYDALHDRARESMNREPMHLSVPLRGLVLDGFLTSLRRRDIEVASVSVGKVHFHVLARFPNHDPRRYIGFAKQSSAAYLRQAGHIGWGGLWGLKSECVPIRDHRHFWKAFGYILDHKKQGSAVWSDPNRQSPPDEFPDPDGLLVD